MYDLLVDLERVGGHYPTGWSAHRERGTKKIIFLELPGLKKFFSNSKLK